MSPAPSPAFSRASSLEREREMSIGPDGSRKVLRIKRLVWFAPVFPRLDFDCRVQVDDEWQTEIIRDPAVIRAYVRARQLLEEEATLADNLAPTGDADKDKRYKKRYVTSSYYSSCPSDGGNDSLGWRNRLPE